jgi:hypothetical protein
MEAAWQGLIRFKNRFGNREAQQTGALISYSCASDLTEI